MPTDRHFEPGRPRRRAANGALPVLLLALVPLVPLRAAEAPLPPVEAQASFQVIHPDGLAARLLGDQPSPVRELDPAIFTDLSPVTASDPALQVPEDQQDDD
ncbi:MAG: hypothetical protein RIC56_14260 [Pseudomonadales bacterium]